MIDDRKSKRGRSGVPSEYPTPASARAALSLFAAVTLMMTAPEAAALNVRSANLSFGANSADEASLGGYLEGDVQAVLQSASVVVHIGPYSETIPTNLFRQRLYPDGSPKPYYLYTMPRDRRLARAPGITRLYLNYTNGRFRLAARAIALKRATNPMPFRLVSGRSDQCVMLRFRERPAIGHVWDTDPITGQMTVRFFNDSSRHSKWFYLSDETQPSCEIKDLVADRHGFTVNRFTQVRVQARVPNPAMSALQIFAVDPSLETMAGPLCDLHDDGHDGDDVARDRTYGCKLDFFEPMPRVIRLVARGLVAGREAISPKIELDVVPELIEEDAAVFLENMYRARDIWGENLQALGNSPAARQQTAAAIRALTFVRDVGFNDKGFLIEFAVADYPGILGYLPALGDEPRQGPIPPGMASALPASIPNSSPASFSLYENVNTHLFAQAAQVPEDDRVKNTRVLIWAPFYSKYFPNDELNDLRHRYATHECPGFKVTLLRDGECTLDSVRHFTDYGTLILATEGKFDPSRLVLDRDKLIDERPLFATGEPVQAIDFVREIVDLYIRDRMDSYGVHDVPERRTPRLIAFFSKERGVVWGVRPELIDELPRRFPESVVYGGWRFSSFNFKMAQSFIGAGARTFVGFSDAVEVPFVRTTLLELFNRMLDGTSIGAAFTQLPISRDPLSNSLVRLAGDGRSTYAGLEGMLNGGFETGTLKSWDSEGDGRVVTGLGPYSPTEGVFAGMISTGLGSTSDAGSIAQRACIPAGAHRLAFDWNLLSEEFRNWCHQNFNDAFEVQVNGTRVFHRNVDGLCNDVTFLNGLTFDSNDDVWASSWRSESVDLAPFSSSRTIDVRFAVSDAGDGSRDTAVLLDRVRFE